MYFLRIMTCRIQQQLLQGSCYETATSYFYQLFKQTLLAFLWANTCVPKQTCLKCTTWVHFQENCSLFEACSLHALMLLPSQRIIFVICWRNCTCFKQFGLTETMKDIDLRHVCFPFLWRPVQTSHHSLRHLFNMVSTRGKSKGQKNFSEFGFQPRRRKSGGWKSIKWRYIHLFVVFS